MTTETTKTVFASLEHWQKGGVVPIADDPKIYAFSNVFEVASKTRAWEKTAVAKNLKYVIEAIRAEGTSPWFAAAHDEFVLVMDGEVEVILKKLAKPDVVPKNSEGTRRLKEDPDGKTMGRIRLRRGHMAMLPVGSAYQMRSTRPGLCLLQTIVGPETIERWSDICQTS